MTTRKNDPDEQWRLLRSLAHTCDVLDPAYPDALVEEELRRASGDPDAIGKRGADLVARLISQRRAASTTRLRSQQKATSTLPPAKTTLSSMPPVRVRQPSDTGPINEE